MQRKYGNQGTTVTKKRIPAGAVGVAFREQPNEIICRYRPRSCSQPALDSYYYCINHILEDKNAPYKSCGYVYTASNKRCMTPTLKTSGLCPLHGWKSNMKRQRSTLKRVPPVTAESLLHSISHTPKKKIKSNLSDLGGSSDSQAVNPFEWDLAKEQINRMNILDCASESESDVEPTTLDAAWKGSNDDSSDAESVDSQMEEPLRHARVFTAEEVAIITRSKLQRLQLLYQRQFERLSYVLKERRRQYLHELNKEKQTYCAIVDQPTSTSRDVKLYEKLKALRRYTKPSSEEAVLQYRSDEKRFKQLNPKGKHFSSHKCTFSEGGVKCSEKTIPQSKYCFKHILDDNSQVLFRACGCQKAGDGICQDTVTALGADQTCIIHVKLPPSHHQVTSQASDSICTPVMEETSNKSYKPFVDDMKIEKTGNEFTVTSNSHNPNSAPFPTPPYNSGAQASSHELPRPLFQNPGDPTLYPNVQSSDFPEKEPSPDYDAVARKRGHHEEQGPGAEDGQNDGGTRGDDAGGREKGKKDSGRFEFGGSRTFRIGKGNGEDSSDLVSVSSMAVDNECTITSDTQILIIDDYFASLPPPISSRGPRFQNPGKLPLHPNLESHNCQEKEPSSGSDGNDQGDREEQEPRGEDGQDDGRSRCRREPGKYGERLGRSRNQGRVVGQHPGGEDLQEDGQAIEDDADREQGKDDPTEYSSDLLDVSSTAGSNSHNSVVDESHFAPVPPPTINTDSQINHREQPQPPLSTPAERPLYTNFPSVFPEEDPPPGFDDDARKGEHCEEP